MSETTVFANIQTYAALRRRASFSERALEKNVGSQSENLRQNQSHFERREKSYTFGICFKAKIFLSARNGMIFADCSRERSPTNVYYRGTVAYPDPRGLDRLKYCLVDFAFILETLVAKGSWPDFFTYLAVSRTGW